MTFKILLSSCHNAKRNSCRKKKSKAVSYISWDKADLLFDHLKKKKNSVLKREASRKWVSVPSLDLKLVQHYKENPKQSLFGFFFLLFPIDGCWKVLL